MDWKIFCDKLTNSIWKSVKPLIGTSEAAEKVNNYKRNTKKIDVLAEDLVIEELKKENVDITLFSEEIGELQIGSYSKYKLVLDPIDGTTNSVRGLPFFSTSIAVAKGNNFEDLFFSYVRNYPTNEIFHANTEGVFYNNRICRCSELKALSKALISIYTYNNLNYEQLKRILVKIGKMRLLGAISIELMYVGCNLLDGLIDLRGDLPVTDIAAGILFIKRAGGKVTTANGGNFEGKLNMQERYTIIAAGNENLHKKFLKMICA